MTDIKQLKDFITSRITEVENKAINPKLENDNGLLLHFIPEILIDTEAKTIDWSDASQKSIIKHSFRKLSDLGTIYTDRTDRIEGYTPNGKFFNCFQNGIVE